MMEEGMLLAYLQQVIDSAKLSSSPTGVGAAARTRPIAVGPRIRDIDAVDMPGFA
jgi:hypothetical protein